MKICVFGAASPLINDKYIKAVEELGREIARRGHSLVFGAGGNGLMGAAARGVHEGGGEILGVIPKFFKSERVEAIFEHCSELIMPETMRERKQIMEDRADAFIITPGGIGTFEEFFEVLTLKQLRRHNKPIAVYNIFDYYHAINMTIDDSIEKGFVKEKCLNLFKVSENMDDLFAYLEAPVENDTPISEFKIG